VRIEVRLYATLARESLTLRSGQPIDIDLPGPTSLLTLLGRLGIDPGAVHLAIVDGRLVHDRRQVLHGGERVALFPPVGGG